MSEFFLFAAVGFLAQLVDGALGMAYGVISATVLISSGVPPAQASASVHAAKIFTGAASAISHIAHRNVDWRVLWTLVIAGSLGGVAGTFLLTSVDGHKVQPWIMGYLGLMGLYILVRSVFPFPRKAVGSRIVAPVGGVGGFADAIGGGGWGPVVTTSLIGAGGEARTVIGSVNSAEFGVTIAISLGFVLAAWTGHWADPGHPADHLAAVGGLVVGGVAAAPLAGYAVRVIPRRPLTAIVGLLILGIAAFQLSRLL